MIPSVADCSTRKEIIIMMSHDHMTHISYLYLPCAITTQYVGLRLNIITAEELSASISCMFRAFKSISSDSSLQHKVELLETV